MFRDSPASTMILGRHHPRGDRVDVECCYLSNEEMSTAQLARDLQHQQQQQQQQQQNRHSPSLRSKTVAMPRTTNGHSGRHVAKMAMPEDSHRRRYQPSPSPMSHSNTAAATTTTRKFSVKTEHREVPEMDINKQRHLWKLFRRRMRREQKEAVEEQLQSRKELDSALQMLEQERELMRAMAMKDPQRYWKRGRINKDGDDDNDFDDDSRDERFGHETVLVATSDASSRSGSSSQGSVQEKEGNFWNFFEQFLRKKGVGDETDTVSTTDNTSVADDYSLSSFSSWKSWQTGTTAGINNCGRHRELLLDHYGAVDDPWSAAYRGDLQALEQRWKHRHDWTLEDEHGHTPLYYACQAGGDKDLRVVLFLLQQWPSHLHIPDSVLESCKMDAVNEYVAELLRDPGQAEQIIQEFESRETRHWNNDDVIDYIEDHFLFGGLYGIAESGES